MVPVEVVVLSPQSITAVYLVGSVFPSESANEPTLVPVRACASVALIVVGKGVRTAGARRDSKNSSRGQPEGRRGNRRRFERPEERDRSVTSCRHQVRNMLHPPLRRIIDKDGTGAQRTARHEPRIPHSRLGRRAEAAFPLNRLLP